MHLPVCQLPQWKVSVCTRQPADNIAVSSVHIMRPQTGVWARNASCTLRARERERCRCSQPPIGVVWGSQLREKHTKSSSHGHERHTEGVGAGTGEYARAFKLLISQIPEQNRAAHGTTIAFAKHKWHMQACQSGQGTA